MAVLLLSVARGRNGSSFYQVWLYLQNEVQEKLKRDEERLEELRSAEAARLEAARSELEAQRRADQAKLELEQHLLDEKRKQVVRQREREIRRLKEKQEATERLHIEAEARRKAERGAALERQRIREVGEGGVGYTTNLVPNGSQTQMCGGLSPLLS